MFLDRFEYGIVWAFLFTDRVKCKVVKGYLSLFIGALIFKEKMLCCWFANIADQFPFVLASE